MTRVLRYLAEHNLPIRVLLVSALAALSLWFTALALPAALLVFLTFVSVPARDPRRPVYARVLAIAGAGSFVAVVVFLVTQAMPGLVRGGQNAAELRALSRLREILKAQDSLRVSARRDPDRDGIGSAAFLTELSGLVALRGSGVLDPAPLSAAYHSVVQTKIGPAASLGGYLFAVCLPGASGSFSARTEDSVDDEAAERSFVAYAWPLDDAQGTDRVFFIDQHESILLFENRKGRELTFAGPNFPPSCDAALRNRTAWKPWRNKKPRSSLPGLPSSANASSQ